jgi:hypothetical protein
MPLTWRYDEILFLLAIAVLLVAGGILTGVFAVKVFFTTSYEILKEVLSGTKA